MWCLNTSWTWLYWVKRQKYKHPPILLTNSKGYRWITFNKVIVSSEYVTSNGITCFWNKIAFESLFVDNIGSFTAWNLWFEIFMPILTIIKTSTSNKNNLLFWKKLHLIRKTLENEKFTNSKWNFRTVLLHQLWYCKSIPAISWLFLS